MSREPLHTDQILSALGGLPGWSFENDALQKEFSFGSFREAVSFIVRIAFEAEQRDHHPELTNVYNRVGIRLSTHDAGNKVTERDFDLAKAIESISWI